MKYTLRNEVKEALLKEYSNGYEIIQSIPSIFFKNGGSIIYFLKENKHENSTQEDKDTFVNFFRSSNPFVFNADTLKSKSPPIIQRIFLDTNFVSNLPKFFSNQRHTLSDFDRMQDTIQKIKNKFNSSYDYNFIFFENYSEYKKGLPYPTLKIAAMRFLTEALEKDVHLLSLEFDPNKKESAKYFTIAQQQWASFIESPMCEHFIRSHSVHYLTLLYFYSLYWKYPDKSFREIFLKLILFIGHNCPKIPVKSLFICWKILHSYKGNIHDLAIFHETDLKSQKKKSIYRIRALSWDTFLYRFFESYSSELSSDGIYLPKLTSLDRKLVDAISLIPIKCIMMNHKENYVEMIFEGEEKFYQFLNENNLIHLLKNKSQGNDYRIYSLIQNIESTISIKK